MKITFILLFTSMIISMLAQPSLSEDALRKQADELAHRFIIVDGHVDLPYRLSVKNFRLTKEFTGLPIQTDEGDFDYVRAKKGGLSAPFMSIYIPSSYQQQPDGGKSLADSLMEMVVGITKMHPDKFGTANSPDDIEKNFAAGKISLPMGMENGAPILKIKDLTYFHKKGIRYITLTHGTDNLICDSSYDTTRTHNGLSPFGREVAMEMNRLGIMVDISHVSDAAFYQVIGVTKAPVIASHSSCRSYTPDFQRNMSDDMIQALGKNGGVIMINFGSTFLDGNVVKSREAMRTKLLTMLEAKGLEDKDEAAKPLVKQFTEENRDSLYADVEMVANHIDHAVKLAGIDHVGLGSDYDGVGDSLPTGLKDVSAYPNLIYTLLKRGYSEEDISKICYKNLFRVWREVERIAGK
ncbi:MAG: dipeptidase [Saprospiraceae bacterium]|nr:dipeptidase [Saprospiraceae bacterium]MCF8250109.1 dipeptidase [Saprospiraceae bacterium]MCF8279373.1 dipeptidase [Bacteroidales bacterium]MCF8311163.1 dipeptidase [Saprospiraceae bacterium]MCF8440456.1 dipeptidase [Saprospiraceae bacterium]